MTSEEYRRLIKSFERFSRKKLSKKRLEEDEIRPIGKKDVGKDRNETGKRVGIVAATVVFAAVAGFVSYLYLSDPFTETNPDTDVRKERKAYSSTDKNVPNVKDLTIEEDPVSKAKRLVSKGRYDEALKILDPIVADSPTDEVLELYEKALKGKR